MPEDFATADQPAGPRTVGRRSCWARRIGRRVRPCDPPRLRPRRLGALLRHRPRRARLEHDDPDYPEWGDFSIAADGQPGHAAACTSRSSRPATSSSTPSTAPASRPDTRDDGAPGPRPQYREDYYGGFLRDPDGNSVEAVYTGKHARNRRHRPPVAAHARRRGHQGVLRSRAGHELGVDEPDHVQIVTDGASISLRHGRAADRARAHRVRRRRRTSRSTRSTRPRPRRATRTTARPASAPSITPATTARSCSTPTATTSRPSTTTARRCPRGSARDRSCGSRRCSP